MGLKDTLTELARTPAINESVCKFGNFYLSLDGETREVLVVALRSGASTMDITRALVADGFKIRREFLGEKRKCFKDPNVQCCLGADRPEVPNDK
jgi:hypothetical protein